MTKAQQAAIPLGWIPAFMHSISQQMRFRCIVLSIHLRFPQESHHSVHATRNQRRHNIVILGVIHHDSAEVKLLKPPGRVMLPKLRQLDHVVKVTQSPVWKSGKMRRADGIGSLGTLFPTNKFNTQVPTLPLIALYHLPVPPSSGHLAPPITTTHT